VSDEAQSYDLDLGEARVPVRLESLGAEQFTVVVAETSHAVVVLDAGPPLLVSVDGQVLSVEVNDQKAAIGGIEARLEPKQTDNGSKGARTGPSTIRSPMPGRVVRVLCAVGQSVTAGQPLVVLEAMKMENELVSSSDGVVSELLVEPGSAIEANAALLRLTPSA
jgi:biotin carboxyl carrier protein